jgi:hypothetical protein
LAAGVAADVRAVAAAAVEEDAVSRAGRVFSGPEPGLGAGNYRTRGDDPRGLRAGYFVCE